jgi:FrmR/RcnR family transcriptional regulator, repressor of frmRAB operon
MAHLTEESAALLKRVRRIAGQVAAIERALTSGEDCETTLHLMAAARGAMNGLLDQFVEAHLHEHVARAGLSNEERLRGAGALLTAIKRYTK